MTFLFILKIMGYRMHQTTVPSLTVVRLKVVTGYKLYYLKDEDINLYLRKKMCNMYADQVYKERGSLPIWRDYLF